MVLFFEKRILRPFSLYRVRYNIGGGDDMSIFEKVALEHGVFPEEVRAEIEAAIERTDLKISAEDLIQILANSIMVQKSRE